MKSTGASYVVVGGIFLVALVGWIGGSAFLSRSCDGDIKCVANNNYIKAANACVGALEHATPVEMEWVDSLWQRKFPHAREARITDGLIVYYGDYMRLKMDSSWMRQVYECKYDPLGTYNTAVRSVPGRLNSNGEMRSETRGLLDMIDWVSS